MLKAVKSSSSFLKDSMNFLTRQLRCLKHFCNFFEVMHVGGKAHHELGTISTHATTVLKKKMNRLDKTLRRVRQLHRGVKPDRQTVVASSRNGPAWTDGRGVMPKWTDGRGIMPKWTNGPGGKPKCSKGCGVEPQWFCSSFVRRAF